MITEEQFNEWVNSPVTEEIFKVLRSQSEEIKEAWVNHSWNEGKAEKQVLEALKARAEAYIDLATIDWHSIEKIVSKD